MKPAIEFHIRSNNVTLRSDVMACAPSKDDPRVIDKEYVLKADSVSGIDGIGGENYVAGSIKCHEASDVEEVCNTLIALVNGADVLPHSFVGIQYCGHMNGEVEPCTVEILWSSS
jgi:hypothetical protein